MENLPCFNRKTGDVVLRTTCRHSKVKSVKAREKLAPQAETKYIGGDGDVWVTTLCVCGAVVIFCL